MTREALEQRLARGAVPNRPQARRARRRPPPHLPGRIDPPKVSGLDRVHPIAVLTCALAVSTAAHVLTARALAGRATGSADQHDRNEPMRVALVDQPAPPPPSENVAPPPRKALMPDRPRPRKNPPIAPERPPPTEPLVPVEAPPPPHHDAPTETLPTLVPGISASSTSASGSFRVGVGNTLYGKPPAQAQDPDQARPYKAKEYAPPYALTEEPVFLDNVSTEEVRRFYPEEARKAKVEAVVRVKLTVDDDGTVTSVKVVEAPGGGFGPAAARLARRYRFKPGRVDGRPVATEIPFTIRFELD